MSSSKKNAQQTKREELKRTTRCDIGLNAHKKCIKNKWHFFFLEPLFGRPIDSIDFDLMGRRNANWIFEMQIHRQKEWRTCFCFLTTWQLLMRKIHPHEPREEREREWAVQIDYKIAVLCWNLTSLDVIINVIFMIRIEFHDRLHFSSDSLRNAYQMNLSISFWLYAHCRSLPPILAMSAVYGLGRVFLPFMLWARWTNGNCENSIPILLCGQSNWLMGIWICKWAAAVAAADVICNERKIRSLQLNSKSQ